jgi:hypothetical protein
MGGQRRDLAAHSSGLPEQFLPVLAHGDVDYVPL